MKRILIIVGTRPEAIKISPIVLAMRCERRALVPILCLTGQHPDIAREALGAFGLAPDLALDCVPPGGDLCTTASSVIQTVGNLIDEVRPDALLVQGDTLSAFAGGLAAALRRIPLAHVEAGLRSGRSDDPFPEELSRRQLSHLATWNFAPTECAVRNLLDEGIAPSTIYQVGNTVVDAMRIMSARISAHGAVGVDVGSNVDVRVPQAPATILVTAHRRENWGAPMHRICAAIRELSALRPTWRFIFSLHPNPELSALLRREFDACRAVRLLESPPYDEWVGLLVSADLVLTDSGGMQEEAAALGKPTLVLREATERPEAVRAGVALVVGTQTGRVISEALRIMDGSETYARMAKPTDVFGDGRAAERIVVRLETDLVAGSTVASSDTGRGIRPSDVASLSSCG